MNKNEKWRLTDLTAQQALGVLSTIFLIGGAVLLADPDVTGGLFRYTDPASILSLAKLLLILGTSGVAFLAWLKRGSA